MWRTSFTNGQVAGGAGRGASPARATPGVYPIAPDYAAGTRGDRRVPEGLRGGRRQGRRRGQAPVRQDPDYQPFLPASSGPGPRPPTASSPAPRRSASSSSTGSSGWPRRIPLYGSGFLTEGGVLTPRATPRSACRPPCTTPTSSTTPPTRSSCDAYRKYGESPSCYSVQAYDAANVLDRALAARPRWTATRSPQAWAASAPSTTARAARGRFEAADAAAEHLPAQGARTAAGLGQLRRVRTSVH